MLSFSIFSFHLKIVIKLFLAFLVMSECWSQLNTNWTSQSTRMSFAAEIDSILSAKKMTCVYSFFFLRSIDIQRQATLLQLTTRDGPLKRKRRKFFSFLAISEIFDYISSQWSLEKRARVKNLFARNVAREMIITLM